MIKRLLKPKLSRSLASQKKSIILIGPRQTGKSTLLRELKPTLVVNLADEATYRDHLKEPSLLRAQVTALKSTAKIMVDEIQRIPSMLNTVQSLIDECPAKIFMLTGSSARKLKRGDVNLLPGRLFWYSLFPLTYWELEGQWNLEKALTTGTLPEIYLQDYGADLLGDYINTYLREEVQTEALTRKLESYARFLDIAAETSGKIINYTQVSSDGEIPKETLRRFYDILVDTLLVHRLPGFTDIKGSRKAIQKEAFIFFDMGVRNAVLKQHRNVFTPTQFGSLFEQWFILQLTAFASYGKKDWRFYYYRDDLAREVDLIVDCGDKLLAIEIKYAKKFKPEFTKGLMAFSGSTKKPVRLFLVYCGDTVQKRENIVITPYQKFLDNLPDV